MTFFKDVHSKQPTVTEKFKDKLKSETIKQCDDYSDIYFRESNGFPTKANKAKLKQITIEEANKLASLEEGNKENLSAFFKDLVLCRGNNEFLIPYHILNPHTEDKEILDYEQKHSIGMLGNINEIIES